MIELNLLPDVKKEYLRAQKTRNAVISGAILTTIAAGVITVILATTVYVGQNAVISLQKKSIQDKHSKLAAQPEIEKYLTVQNQLKNIDSLHDGKYLYSRAFSYLQSLNPASPNNVALSTVSLTKETKTIELEGTARNFEALSVYKMTLETAQLKYASDGADGEQNIPMFDSVSLVEAGLKNIDGKNLVSFRMQITYPDTIFLASTKNGKVQVPSQVTSDGDRNAPKPSDKPAEVFGTEPEGAQ